jgi:TolB protein
MDAFQVEVQPLGRPRRLRRRRVVVALVLLGLAVGAGALLATGTARLDRTGTAHRDRIAYVDQTGALSVIGAAGAGNLAYAVDGARFQFPAWSPDGTKLAAIGGNATQGGIYVFDDAARVAAKATVAAPQTIVVYPPSTSYPIYLFWSPDGRRLAFITNEPDGLALQVVPADGSGPPTIVRRGQPMYWDWVDDAHLFVHSGGDSQDAFVGEIPLDVSPDAAKAEPIQARPGQFQAPGVSHVGGNRAYLVAPTSDAAEVVIADSSGATRFQATVAGASAIGWSPTGDRLAFIAPVQPNGLPYGTLDILDATSGATRTLLDGLVVAYFWSPDGRTIAAIRVVAAGAPTASVVPIAATAPSLRLTLVDVATARIRLDRDIRLPDLVVGQFVPFFDQYALSHRLWSATGDAIVLPLVDDAGQSHVTIVPADGTTPRRLADGIAAFWSP